MAKNSTTKWLRWLRRDQRIAGFTGGVAEGVGTRVAVLQERAEGVAPTLCATQHRLENVNFNRVTTATLILSAEKPDRFVVLSFQTGSRTTEFHGRNQAVAWYWWDSPASSGAAGRSPECVVGPPI